MDNRLTSLSDEELAIKSMQGDVSATDTLMDRYKTVVLKISKAYYIAGAEQSDIVQEGMIGLFKAVRDYDSSKNTSFKTFASLCIKRQIIDALKSAGRNKHLPLNESLPLEAIEYITSYDNPINLLMDNESHNKLIDRINSVLSSYEVKILELYIAKMSYKEIADTLNKDIKSIDNAIQRIKSKVKRLLA